MNFRAAISARVYPEHVEGFPIFLPKQKKDFHSGRAAKNENI